MPALTDSPQITRTPRARGGAGRALQKGLHTKAVIVEAALGLATHIGLEGLSIGALADITGMSKSGVFAHFGSREELQISVIREYHARFEHEVFYPAMSARRGVDRLRAMFDHWMQRTSVEIDSGCIFVHGVKGQAGRRLFTDARQFHEGIDQAGDWQWVLQITSGLSCTCPGSAGLPGRSASSPC